MQALHVCRYRHCNTLTRKVFIVYRQPSSRLHKLLRDLCQHVMTSLVNCNHELSRHAFSWSAPVGAGKDLHTFNPSFILRFLALFMLFPQSPNTTTVFRMIT